MSAAAPSPSRIASLDGLRGTAALVVLVHHALLTISGFAAVYWGLPVPKFAAPFGFTPLHLIWAGAEAVLVFFVLSGVVLVLPAVRKRPLPWRAYYPSRLIRLYLPVVCAVVFAVVLARLWPRAADAGYSPWVQMHNEAPTVATAMHNAFLLNGTTWLNSPLWSLQWEVLFSLLLPLYAWIAIRWGRKRWPIIGAALLTLIIAGDVLGIAALRFLPYFGFGALIAVNYGPLDALASRFNKSWRSLVAQTALLLAALFLLLFRWWPGNMLPSVLGQYNGAVVALGAIAVVLAAICLPIARTAFSSRALVAAGAISFSLYLVHEPILVTLAVVFPSDMPWLAPLVGVPLALVVGWLFFVLVEKQTHRLARATARRLTPRGAHPASKPGTAPDHDRS